MITFRCDTVTNIWQLISPFIHIAYPLRISAHCSCQEEHWPDDASISY